MTRAFQENFLKEHLYARIDESELFTKKFGTFAKSDFEILMFTVFLDSIPEAITDYEISIALGITESKVRSLRTKSQLLYPRTFDWKEILISAIKNGWYDPKTAQVTITIDNPSVRNYIRNEIEKRFVVNISLNAKQLVLPIESFFFLAAIVEENEDDVIKKLSECLKSEYKWIGNIEKSSKGRRVFTQAKNIADVLNTIQALYSVGRPIIDALITII